ncbi:MAG: hypothetical protein QW620_04950 [Thermoplasmata archaeon]
MKLNVVRFYNFYPKSEFPVLHSDTVFGAVCNAIAELEGDAELVKILERMEKNTADGFCVSSGFPFVESGGQLRHLMPFEVLSLSEKKEMKGKFVDVEFFKETSKEIDDFIYSPPKGVYRVRNRVGREMETPTTLFSVPYIIDPERDVWGFWFAYAGDTKLCEEAFRFLRDEGIGGDRNVGSKCEKIEFATLEVLDSGNYFTNLSLYVPAEDELNGIVEKDCWYKLICRHGWREVDGVGKESKPARYYFTEGSVFSTIGKKTVYGKCSQFEHLRGVWWSGLTIPLYFNNVEGVIKSLQSKEN